MLHEFLTANRDELIDRCSEFVVKRSAPAAEPRELEHGIPQFIDQLTRTLQLDKRSNHAESVNVSGTAHGESAVSASEIGVSAARHGNELLQKGFTIGQVVHDYGDLCQAIMALSLEKNASISVDEYRTFNRCLDNAIADAVSAYEHTRDAAVTDQGRRSMNERLGTLAHEMRNLLNSVVLALEAIKAGSAGLAGATAGVLDRNLAAMADLINRSMAQTRLEAGLPALRERIAVAEFIQHFEVSGALEARSKSIRFTVHPVEKGLAVVADCQMLSAAVSNLLQNAFKFTHPNGLVVLKAYAIHDRVLIDVEDECGGLPPGNANEMFRPFHQRAADRTGLGLGLSITSRSIEANGGKLQVRDIPGTGCVFRIDLPRQPHIGASDSDYPGLPIESMVLTDQAHVDQYQR